MPVTSVNEPLPDEENYMDEDDLKVDTGDLPSVFVEGGGEQKEPNKEAGSGDGSVEDENNENKVLLNDSLQFNYVYFM